MMNCLFLLVLLSCCGNCGSGRFGLGSSCPVQGSDECGCVRERREERRGEREDRSREREECSCEREERGRERDMRSGSNNRRRENEMERNSCDCREDRQGRNMGRYDSSMRGQEFADSVPGMSRPVMNGYAAYQDGCSCGG